DGDRGGRHAPTVPGDNGLPELLSCKSNVFETHVSNDSEEYQSIKVCLSRRNVDRA
ncbi:hypothetical protein pipiens_019100, partial [Culex pipiens pipiens]